jgi:hypothetical protein
VGVIGPLAEAAAVDLGALGLGLGSGQRSMRRRTVRDVGTLSQTAAPAPGAMKVKKTRAGGGGGPPVSASAAVGENWSTMPSHHNLSYSTVLRHQPRTSLKPGFHDSALCRSWTCNGIPVHLQVSHFRVLQTGDFEGGPYDRENGANMQRLPEED